MEDGLLELEASCQAILDGYLDRKHKLWHTGKFITVLTLFVILPRSSFLF